MRQRDKRQVSNSLERQLNEHLDGLLAQQRAIGFQARLSPEQRDELLARLTWEWLVEREGECRQLRKQLAQANANVDRLHAKVTKLESKNA